MGSNNPFFGKHHDIDARKRIGVAQVGNQHGKGNFPSDEIRNKKSVSMKRVWACKDYKARLRKSQIGKRSKLTFNQVNEVLNMLTSGMTMKNVALAFDVGIGVIRKVKNGTYSVKCEN